MRSLRDGMLGEALAIYQRAAADDATRVDATIGSAACHVVARQDRGSGRRAGGRAEVAAGRAEARSRRAGAWCANACASLRRTARRPTALAQIAGGAGRGRSRRGGDPLRRAGRRGRFEEPTAIATAALAAVRAGADAFDVAFLCYDAIGDARLEALLHLYSSCSRCDRTTRRCFSIGASCACGWGTRRARSTTSGPASTTRRLGARAQLQYGSALIRVNRAEESLPIFEKLSRARHRNSLGEALKGIESVAVSRARARKFADALVLYREVLAKNPTSLYARIGEPLCLRNLGDYENAAAAYEAGIAALPEESQLLNDYALMLKAHGEEARALEMFERALGAGSADAGENLGIIAYREKHDPELAARYFARTITMLNESKQRPRPRVLFYRELCLAETAARPPK